MRGRQGAALIEVGWRRLDVRRVARSRKELLSSVGEPLIEGEEASLERGYFLASREELLSEGVEGGPRASLLCSLGRGAATQR